jgi:hypothetical protein
MINAELTGLSAGEDASGMSLAGSALSAAKSLIRLPMPC